MMMMMIIIRTAGLVEGEDHASSDDNLVASLQQGLDHANLGGDLGSSDNGGKRTLRVGDRSVQVGELLLEEEPGHGRRQVLGHSLSGGVGAMGGTEGVVDVEVSDRGELLGKLRVVLLLLLVEADVLQQQHVSVAHGFDGGLDLRADAVVGLLDLLSEELGEAHGTRGQPELVLRSVLGASQVGAQDDLGTVVGQVLEGRDGGPDTGVVGDGASVQRDVEVGADKHDLALEVSLGEVSDRLLGHGRDSATSVVRGLVLVFRRVVCVVK